MHHRKDDKWRSYCWIVDGNRREARPVGRKLVDVRQLVQVPNDAGSVIRSTHKDAVGHRGSKAGHCLRVPIQSLVGKKQPIHCSSGWLIYQGNSHLLSKNKQPSHSLENWKGYEGGIPKDLIEASLSQIRGWGKSRVQEIIWLTPSCTAAQGPWHTFQTLWQGFVLSHKTSFFFSVHAALSKIYAWKLLFLNI